MKKAILIVVTTIGILVGISLLTMYAGSFGIFYTKTVGTEQTNADREVFKHSLPYTEQSAKYLVDSYKEYNETKDTVEKKAIMNYVADRYPNLDTDAIDNPKLASFYENCLLGGN